MSPNDIKRLPDTHWGPVFIKSQSRYSRGLCERCAGWIECGERHETRLWKLGPAESTQHLVCPRDIPCQSRDLNCPCANHEMWRQEAARVA